MRRNREHRMERSEGSHATASAVRVDRWLWAARFCKSRSLAAQACEGGKVQINGQRAKAHKLVRPDDKVSFRHSRGLWEMTVLAVTERRGPAPVARLLYEDNSPPPATEQSSDLSESLSRTPQRTGRPTKRERRETEWLRRR